MQRMVDMAVEEETPKVFPAGIAADVPKSRYPYGLRLCFDETIIDRLDLDEDECEIGTVIELRAIGTITSVSTEKLEGGKRRCRVEIQIEKLAIDESLENVEYEED